MTLQQFVLIIDRGPTAAELDEIFLRHDDLSVEENRRRRSARVWADRHAPSLLDAALSAIRDLDRVGLPAVGFAGDDLVTIHDIGERTARSSEAVRILLAEVLDPAVAAVLDRPDTYLSWRGLSRLLGRNSVLNLPDTTAVAAALNLALRLRALVPAVPRMAAIRSLIPE